MLKKLLLLTTTLAGLTYAIFRINKYRKVTTSAKQFHTKFTQERGHSAGGSEGQTKDAEVCAETLNEVNNSTEEHSNFSNKGVDFQDDFKEKCQNQGPE